MTLSYHTFFVSFWQTTHGLSQTTDMTDVELIKVLFTSSNGVVKNPQFWAQFFRASDSALRRYLLKRKVPSAGRHLKMAGAKNCQSTGSLMFFPHSTAAMG